MGLLEGKVAIITGAGGGLGGAYARLFAKEGCAVVVNDFGGSRDGANAGASPMAQQVVDDIIAAGGRAVADGGDVSKMETGEALLKAAIDNFGQIDILVNNAGILRDRTFTNMTEAEWDAVVGVHLKGTFCVTQPVFKWMKDNGKGGVIVNTSSTSALYGNFGQTNYGAAKGGIAGFTRVLAIEGRRYGIRVWGLAPGAYTRMTSDLPGSKDGPRPGSLPEDLAPGVLYMVSDLSGDQTGKFMGLFGRGINEIKIVATPGWKPEAGWTAQDLAKHASEVFFPDDPARVRG
jgi:NAD(P)-dependent dehydrogenase (short-subunit alcohol dehydrogenase family)